MTLEGNHETFSQLSRRGWGRRLRELVLSALKHYDLNVARLSLVTNDTNGSFRVDTRSGEKWIVRVAISEGGHTHNYVIAEDVVQALTMTCNITTTYVTNNF